MSDIQQLRDDSATIRRLATERLDQLREPTLALLATIDGAINFMATRTAAVDRRFALARPEHEHASRAVAKERLSRSLASPGDRAASEQSHAAAFIRERCAALVVEDVQTHAAAASKTAARVLEAAGQLEDAVAKLSLASGPIGDALRRASSATLQELLAEQRIVAELETQPCAALRDHLRQLRRLDPQQAVKVESYIGRIARARSSEEWVKYQHRRRVKTPRDGEFSGEMVQARLLLAEIEAGREARQPADLAVYTAEVRPTLGSLLRRTIGIDPRNCSATELEVYIQRWRPGARLDQLPILETWPLRYRAVAAPTPQPLAPSMPARFAAG